MMLVVLLRNLFLKIKLYLLKIFPFVLTLLLFSLHSNEIFWTNTTEKSICIKLKNMYTVCQNLRDFLETGLKYLTSVLIFSFNHLRFFLVPLGNSTEQNSS